VPAGDDVGKVATHTSFVDVNYAARKRASDYVPTPDPGTTWYLLVGATEPGADGSELAEWAHSYRTPAQIEVERDPGEPEELHRGRVLLEGYDFAERAYCFRKQGEDRFALTMTPTSSQINPVFVVNGWASPGVTVTVNGVPLSGNAYRCQIRDHDLVVWVEGRFDSVTRFEFAA
jgi:hypothetical protein